MVAKVQGKTPNNGDLPEEEREKDNFRLLENGSNFPLFSHGEDGKLTFDRRKAQVGPKEHGLREELEGGQRRT